MKAYRNIEEQMFVDDKYFDKYENITFHLMHWLIVKPV